MNQALWISKTGLDAQQTRMNVVSNNLANVNTTAFKKGRASFEDLIYQTIRQPGAQEAQNNQLPTGLMTGVGVRTVATDKIFTQGNHTQTDNALDVSIQGRGFFEILTPEGNVAYTRDGSFQLNADGQMVMSNGYELQPGIFIPEGTKSIHIGQDGIVSATLAGQEDAPVEVGNIQLADFVNPAGLEPVGQNLFVETAASGAPQQGNPGQDGLGRLMQGSLESSNVNIAEELVNMIETQRAYEINSKSISTSDQMMQFLNQNL
ncbi:flagellar basal-body rod protein FlgG [Ectothiorhodospira variabilis]|uniref:flagellar basal-body rod protein FlgG n=1 Tax=Ectothiorhodospira variabilis TaxID=505694 RepID=UPI001EFB9FA6|nr:flagellar basal-body rod protein FlgG [Ectothiorhodospira variabilis]MCG5493050.1 flagellar basal-body rod protein FlgG [Ectothiorhodospira variabilis]MCG5502379.1 flagellar basal-body rod protein FlgG [Ectothiorhodospira variabilis]MCG5505855.1 flagellar basal-body rod protein FlgG [Ectothiorhodospira variabilis]